MSSFLNKRHVKCIIVGDGAVGKTSMLISYTRGEFPEDHVPTIFENYTAKVNVGKEEVQLELLDTAGQEDFDRIRWLSYPGADVIICCYSVASRTTLANVRSLWYPEFRHYCPDTPFILCGTKGDLRLDPTAHHVRFEDAQAMGRELGAHKVIECSAKTGNNVKDIFDEAILAVVKPQRSCTLM